jgi:rhamnulokinase
LTATVAAADLGAQSGRVAVGRFDGGKLTVEEVHRFPNVPVHTGTTLRWDLTRLYADVLDGLRAAGRDGSVDSVGVDSWGVDFGLVDARGELLANPVHYRDTRRAAEFQTVPDRVPFREIYERTGIQLMPINTIFALAAMASDADPALESADRLLLIPDLVHHWLCGSDVSERTNATTTQCLDVRTGTWITDILDRLEIPARILPDVVPPATVIGTVSEETGIGEAKVVATATHDTGSAVAAIPLRGDRSAYASVGTWSLVGVETREPVVTDDGFRANVTNEGGVEGTVRVLRNVSGMWLLQECARVWGLAGRTYSSEDLVALAQAAEPLRCFVEPNDPSFSEPGDMPSRIAAYCTRTRQPEPADDGAVVRCVLESLALKHAESVDELAALTGREIEEIHVVGGGARNEPLCRWTASAAGRAVLAGPAEATLLGNLLVQLIALGEVGSLDEGRELVRRSITPSIYEPADESAWTEARGRFATLTRSNHPMEVGA